jgi:hypothetical protein
MCGYTETFEEALENLNVLHRRYIEAVKNDENQLELLAVQNRTCTLPMRQKQFHIQKFPGPLPYRFKSTWDPIIGEAAFRKIRSFRVEITLSSKPVFLHPFLAADEHYYNFLDQIVFTASDSVRKVIGRLETVRPHIRDLEIFIRTEDMSRKQDELLAAAQVLLRPFQRLRNVSNPRVRSVICFYDELHRTTTVKTLFPTPTNEKTEADSVFENYLRGWGMEMSSCGPAPEPSAISTVYWQLGELVHNIKYTIWPQRDLDSLEDPNTFESLLHVVKSAREAEDLVRFKEMLKRIVKIWGDYVNKQDQIRDHVTREIKSLYAAIDGETNDIP